MCFCDKQIYDDIIPQPLGILTVTLSTLKLKTNRKNQHINEHARNKHKNKRKMTSNKYNQRILSNTNSSITGENMVINLSNRAVSETGCSLLSKGFKFVPTRKNIDKGKLIADLDIWERQMQA